MSGTATVNIRLRTVKSTTVFVSMAAQKISQERQGLVKVTVDFRERLTIIRWQFNDKGPRGNYIIMTCIHRDAIVGILFTLQQRNIHICGFSTYSLVIQQ